MKKYLKLFFLITISFASRSQNPQWVQQFGNTDYEFRQDMITDPAGNTYLAGNYYQQTIIGSDTLTTTPFTTCGFLTKFNTSGTILWTIPLGTGSLFSVGDMAFDNSGNLLIGGAHVNTIQFGLNTYYCLGPSDILLAKYDTSGNLLWSQQYSGAGDETILEMEVNASNSIIISGVFNGVTPFTGFPLQAWTAMDIFIAELDASGNVQWAKSCGGADVETPNGMKLDAAGNIYICGRSMFDFNYNGQTFAGSVSIFVFKMSASGNFGPIVFENAGWGSAQISNMTIDNAGHLYAVLNTYPNLSFGGVAFPNPLNNWAAFVKLDTSLNVQWIRSYQRMRIGYFTKMIGDAQGNLYAAGEIKDTLISGSDTLLSPLGDRKTFIAKTDSALNGIWAFSYDVFNGAFISSDAAGCVYASNDFVSGSIGTTQLMSAGLNDVYLAKFCISPTGINEVASAQISIYPNPASTHLSVSIPPAISLVNAQLQVINAMGKLVFKSKITNSENTFMLTGLSNGIYFVRFTSDAIRFSQKIIKQ